MISIFSIPKPFEGHNKVIQNNAIHSWLKLQPSCQVILFGDEEGIAQTAKEFDVQHVPHIKRNEFGTPLLDHVFRTAHKLAKHNILCYVNADIILMSDFMKGVQIVARRMNKFLIVGRRWNVDILEPLNFDDPEWEKELRDFVMNNGELFFQGADYFAFPRKLFREIPPFAVGRAAWDNWMTYKARSLFAPVVNITGTSMVVHQNHDYSHHSSGKKGVFHGVEAERNKALAGGSRHLWTVHNSTHIFTGSKLVIDKSCARLGQYLHELTLLLPWTAPLVGMIRKLAGFRHSLRRGSCME
jgi:hypothetical protein